MNFCVLDHLILAVIRFLCNAVMWFYFVFSLSSGISRIVGVQQSFIGVFMLFCVLYRSSETNHL